MTASGGSGGELVVCADFAATEVVLVVLGELDVVSAPQLRAVSLAMVDGGHRQVVLDLAGCGSVDAAGLRVIAETAEHLDVWGGHRLMIRSPSMAVRRALNLSESTKFAIVDDPEPDVDGTARAASTASAVTDRDDLVRHLGAVSALRVGRDDIDAALRLVVALAQAVVGGADGVSVSLRRDGQLSTVAASDQTILSMDTDQYATGEGPCVDASVQGQRFHAESLTNETRWPAFTPQALELGINSILSSPLVVADRPVGALNIYSRSAKAFAATDQRLASLFAVQASTVVAGAADVTAEQVANRLEEALQTREVIALAQGVLMERRHLDRYAAYRALRRSSVSTGKPLRDRRTCWYPPRRGRSNLPLARRTSMGDQMTDTLDQARCAAGLSHGELWLRYFELGGMSTALQLEAFLYGALQPSTHDHDVIAHALNERFVELGGNHPVAYLEDSDVA